MRVPFVDLAALHAGLVPDLRATTERIIASGRFIQGQEVEGFEEAVARFLGVRHAIGVSSGTDALLIALAAAGVEAGTEVVTTPFSFFATVEAIMRLGALPRFVDVDPRTLNLCPASAEEALTSRTRAVLPVHLYGSPASSREFAALAARREVPLVEDAAQAFAASSEGRRAGTWGTVGCFSFFPTKVLGALGDGGLVVTDSDTVAARCRRLREHGREHGAHVEVGGNFRLDALQAGFLRAKLPHVEAWIEARRRHARAYDAALLDLEGLGVVERTDGWNGAVYTVRIGHGRRDSCRAHLASAGVETGVYYGRPLHLEPALRHLGHGPGAFPHSEVAAAEVLSLPVHPEMSDAQRDHVVATLRAFFP